jgi:hypothetical protein
MTPTVVMKGACFFLRRSIVTTTAPTNVRVGAIFVFEIVVVITPVSIASPRLGRLRSQAQEPKGQACKPNSGHSRAAQNEAISRVLGCSFADDGAGDCQDAD